MPVEFQLLLWWLLFGGTHIAGSSVAVRTRLIRTLGIVGFKSLYSVVAFLTLGPLVWIAWNHRHEGQALFDPPSWSVSVTEGLMLVSFLFLVLAFTKPNPATTAAEMSGHFPSTARGIHRVTRHPMNLAFVLFGLAHMGSNPTVGDWIFWGGFAVYGVVSAMHQDRRTRVVGPEACRTFQAQTSLVPFAAILSGRQRLVLGEIGWWAVLAALALFLIVRWIHPAVIGGYP